MGVEEEPPSLADRRDERARWAQLLRDTWRWRTMRDAARAQPDSEVALLAAIEGVVVDDDLRRHGNAWVKRRSVKASDFGRADGGPWQ